MVAALPAAVSPQRLLEACGEEPGRACEWIFERTESELLADVAEWAVDRPLQVLLILLVAILVARVLRRLIGSAVMQASDNSLKRRLQGVRSSGEDGAEAVASTARAAQRGEAIAAVLRSAVSFLVYLIAAFMILGEIGVELAPLLAGAGVVGLAIGFGAQSLVRDFLSGIFILIEDQYGVGDIVDLGEATGTVESVSLRTTRLRSVDGVVWHIANGEVVRVGNMSQHWSRSLLDIEVAYDTDLKLAKRLIAEVASAYASSDEDVIDEPEVWGVEALGASGIAIRLVVKTKPREQWRISRELRERIKERFDEEGIEIPFPQQTVWMRAAPQQGQGPATDTDASAGAEAPVEPDTGETQA